MSICENSSTAVFDADFTKFALPPKNESKEDHACFMYQPIDPNEDCISTNFDQNEMIACPNSRYVFSNSIPYDFSLVEELQLPPCKTGDWPLKVSQTKIGVLL